ncbi:MAG: hypothetical protein A3D65_02845 [Candidatus Lloydbacteria bacterium RIFCSPHIGHO2_02_FULL_50_13]|uniref:Uncharacterized protein n=1 Tax=Candidatus Lloydbacteria bacterium RIFCSPHIGHO2_02_FULL_50_13 TaxID=1798661 RepID=A0A1G2D958_9BACT|nr:MAG: hypothetical protein A3D65_02845 [Candidatus Lloydbacteria bacterium RIFCSPHIGHO2_02_FULL_50_13]
METSTLLLISVFVAGVWLWAGVAYAHFMFTNFPPAAHFHPVSRSIAWLVCVAFFPAFMLATKAEIGQIYPSRS